MLAVLLTPFSLIVQPALHKPLARTTTIAATTVAPLASRAAEPTMSAAAFLALDAIEPAVSSYVAIWTPLFEGAKASGLAPEALLHWGHAAAMSTVLFAMGGYGAFLGWATRFGNGAEVYPLSQLVPEAIGNTARELHPKLMGAALFFFLLGGQGGLVLLATAGEPLLKSAHSSTAVIGIGLLIAQAGLGATMGGSETGRTAHAFLGSGTLAALTVHAYFGLNLGLSF